MKKIFSGLVFILIAIISFSQVITDTVLYPVDSVAKDMTGDCSSAFFQRSERVSSFGKTKIQTKEGKLMTMTAFLSSQDISMESQHAVIDLDKDGKKELVIYNYTGGAHCCDEYYFFRNTGPDRYQFVGKTFGGDLCITDSNRFEFYFYESFGYFFTCFACLYTDESDEAPLPVDHITFYYQKGKLLVEKGNQELKSLINDNLAKLGEQPYQKLEEEVDHDNGLRKEFAKNLAVYYYAYGKNLPQTQALFNKYYKHPDAKKVWAAFVKHLQYLKKDNSF